SIGRARAELDRALADLEKMPEVDPGSVQFTAHALNNFLTVTSGAIELLLLHLADYPDAQVQIWLEGLRHATNLMSYAVNQLRCPSPAAEIKPNFEAVDLPLLVQRCC